VGAIAPNHQGRGLATSAGRQFIKIAFESTLISDVGKVWKWEIGAV